MAKTEVVTEKLVKLTLTEAEAREFTEWLGQAEGSGKGTTYEIWSTLRQALRGL